MYMTASRKKLVSRVTSRPSRAAEPNGTTEYSPDRRAVGTAFLQHAAPPGGEEVRHAVVLPARDQAVLQVGVGLRVLAPGGDAPLDLVAHVAPVVVALVHASGPPQLCARMLCEVGIPAVDQRRALGGREVLVAPVEDQDDVLAFPARVVRRRRRRSGRTSCRRRCCTTGSSRRSPPPGSSSLRRSRRSGTPGRADRRNSG